MINIQRVESRGVYMDEVEIVKKKRQLLKEFIELYESYPCLWHVKSQQYHDRDLRARAYKVLIKKLQEIQPNADRPAVVKKINCLRCNVRKEKKKTLEYLKAGRVYKTKLWYYPLFSFLNGMNRQPGTESEEPEEVENIKVEDKTNDPLEWPPEIEEESSQTENISYDEVMITNEEAYQPRYEMETQHIPGPSKQVPVSYEPKDTTCRRTHEDRHDVFGKNVAMKLRHISSKSDTQRIMAENIINEAMYMAEMGLLTMEHCKVLK